MFCIKTDSQNNYNKGPLIFVCQSVVFINWSFVIEIARLSKHGSPYQLGLLVIICSDSYQVTR